MSVAYPKITYTDEIVAAFPVIGKRINESLFNWARKVTEIILH
jgi:hypothetical protein